MQTNNQDISAMLDCVSEMFGGVSASIDFESRLTVYTFMPEVGKKQDWRLTIHTPSIIQKHFDSWSELSAWVRSQDRDFSEQVIIEEMTRDEQRLAEVSAAMVDMFEEAKTANGQDGF